MQMNYWDHLEHHVDYEQTWMAHPLVRAAINTRVGGDPNVWPVSALRRWLGDRAPLGSCLSIGCGLGGLERSLIEEGISREVTGVDVSEAVVAEARRAASDRGMAIRYVAADARQFLREQPRAFDAILFHQSLHHFDRLEELMDLVAEALRPDGFLWFDEYIGPARDEWTLRKLIAPAIAYYRFPSAMRRPHLVRAPINYEDPTEAIASSGILPGLERRFRIVNRRDYGGNLLAILYPNLRKPGEGGLPPSEFDRWIAKLIQWDGTAMLRRASWFTVVLAKRQAITREVTI